MDKLKNIKAGDLNISYYETGKADGKTVFLLHGFPYDIQAYREVAPILAKEGCRVIVPYLRGFGRTTFIKPDNSSGMLPVIWLSFRYLNIIKLANR